MKYVWIEESPNTASDCGVAPPKKGDGLRSRRGTTRKVEEHFPRHVQGLEWRKSSRSFAGKTVWRADGDKNPQKRYVQGSDGRTREVGRWSASGEAGGGGASPEKPHAPAREMQPPAENGGRGCSFGAGAFTKVGDLLQALLLGPERNTVTGRFPGVDDTGNRKELGFLLGSDTISGLRHLKCLELSDTEVGSNGLRHLSG
ncbi:hypothetical protein CK203_104234 [Vitis vinifera]|uniref:Uncharacterized protein n=1 Tax=Vitis vinifera TaxID=29760 RepID=A0A438FGM4_VITVI|nr:hypothetical protein CK203_104234 [Vitis vinifera]